MEKIKKLLGDFRKYWLKPPKGRYMSFKEIASLSVGGIGHRLVVYCINQMILSVGNVLIGNTIGIAPRAMYAIYIISVLSGFPLTALRAKMIDNTRSMKGKYRPYIISMGIPTAAIGVLFIITPYEHMSLFWKCAAVLAYNIGFQFFSNFYNDSFDSLINVLSPNSIERSDVLSIKSIVENLSPSIVTILLPIVAKWITGEETLYDIKIYRILFPPLIVFGFLLSLLAYVNTSEKIVQAKTHVIQMKFSDAFRAIAKNKYFWIISLAGWLGFLESSFNNIIGWMYSYQKACTPGQYAIVTAIAGNAAFWPNVVAPFFIRKFGKKKILVFTNVMNIFFIMLMLPVVKMTGDPKVIWMFLVFIFINNFTTALGHLLNPSIQADIRDYQQYVTGERIDGMFAAVGLIGNAITLATSSVLPTIYEKAGLNKTVAISLGYDGSNVYDVLYNSEYFVKICSVLIIASVVGATMNVIPFFFYDLTETDQRGMVRVLKIRALFEDWGNGVLEDNKLIETYEIIKEAKEYENKPLSVPEKKAGKEEKKKILEENEKIRIASRVTEELLKYNTEQGAAEIRIAKSIVAAGLNGFQSIEIPDKKTAKAMPKSTESEKEIRRNTLMRIESYKTSEKAIKKYFPNGIEEFDSKIFDELFTAEYENEVAINEALKALKAAKESKRKEDIAEIKQAVKAYQKERSQIAAKIKKATDENSIYYRAAKPYLDAVKLLNQAENYTHLDEIEGLYQSALARAENV
ncbi:MAG: MFS transporter [Eubacterium sp.]|nr:MFS transporter [Eubacterium sp.]